MLEPAFSEEFSKILKQMNRNIIYVNGLAHYQIPVHQIKLLEKLFYSNGDNITSEDVDNKPNDEDDDIYGYLPVI